MDMITVNIVDIARADLQTARTLAENPNYAIQTPPTFLLDSSDELFVWGNSTQLSQVFNNLLSNAVKFSPDGGRIWCLLPILRSKISSKRP
jgi:signal transduction histidine kinase